MKSHSLIRISKGILTPKTAETSLSEQAIIAQALDNPVGAAALGEIVKPGETVVIVTSDITRPMPTAKVLPCVVNALNQGGIEDKDICIVFGLGVHRPHTPEEHKKLVGAEMYERIACYDSPPDDVVHLGDTTRGTPVDLSRRVVEADRCICFGNIEYHYFAGFSGGMKAIMPGVSTRAAIQANHSRMVESDAIAGKLDGNPVREDIEEVARFFTVDYIVNVVLNEKKQIINAFAGDVVQAHNRAGCAYLDSLIHCDASGGQTSVDKDFFALLATQLLSAIHSQTPSAGLFAMFVTRDDRSAAPAVPGETPCLAAISACSDTPRRAMWLFAHAAPHQKRGALSQESGYDAQTLPVPGKVGEFHRSLVFHRAPGQDNLL